MVHAKERHMDNFMLCVFYWLDTSYASRLALVEIRKVGRTGSSSHHSFHFLFEFGHLTMGRYYELLRP